MGLLLREEGRSPSAGPWGKVNQERGHAGHGDRAPRERAFGETAPEASTWQELQGGLEAGEEVAQRLQSDFGATGVRVLGAIGGYLGTLGWRVVEPSLHGFAHLGPLYIFPEVQASVAQGWRLLSPGAGSGKDRGQRLS